jgi:phage N-6-adenine-methyltransferase
MDRTLPKSKTTKSKSLHDVDSSIPAPTLDELTETFKEEAKLLNETDLSRIGKQLFDRWLRQAERISIATNVHGVEVTAFAKMVKLNRAIAFDLKLLWKNHAEIIAVAENEGRWYYWRDMVAAWAGRKPAERNTIRDQRLRIEELTEEVTKLCKRKFESRGRPGHRGSENRPSVQYVYDYLHVIHNFDWDCCASELNTKVPGHFFDKEQDALKQPWKFQHGYCNPPYHAQAMRDFLAKAIEELRAGHCKKVVFLLPAWTDASWFLNLAAHGHIQFIKGRIAFMNGDSGEEMDVAKFGSMVVTMTKESMLNDDKLSAARLTIHPTDIVPRAQQFPSNYVK